MFQQIKNATRISLGFALVLLLMLGMGLFAPAKMATIDNKANEIAGTWRPGVKLVQQGPCGRQRLPRRPTAARHR